MPSIGATFSPEPRSGFETPRLPRRGQHAAQVLSLRLPRTVGAASPVPEPLLRSGGTSALGFDPGSAVLSSILQRRDVPPQGGTPGSESSDLSAQVSRLLNIPTAATALAQPTSAPLAPQQQSVNTTVSAPTSASTPTAPTTSAPAPTAGSEGGAASDPALDFIRRILSGGVGADSTPSFTLAQPRLAAFGAV